MCYTYGTERMERNEEASEGVSAQEIATPPTEIDYSRIKQVLFEATSYHMELENKSINQS